MDENKRLLQALKENDSNLVLSKLYKTLLPKFVAFVKKNNGTKVDAEDCFQDAVTILIEKVRKNNIEELSVKEYLFQVARFRWYRKIKKVISRETELEVDDRKTSDAMDIFLAEEKQNTLNELLGNLGETCKQLLHFFFYEQKTMTEIANLMQLKNLDVAKASKYRCMIKLKKIIAQHPEYSTSLRD